MATMSSSQKIFTFTGMDTYAKESYNHSGERVTVLLSYVAIPESHLKLNEYE